MVHDASFWRRLLPLACCVRVCPDLLRCTELVQELSVALCSNDRVVPWNKIMIHKNDNNMTDFKKRIIL